VIDWANRSPPLVVSLDVPSGVDSTTGSAGIPAVTADATLTIALPKNGLVGNDLVGDLYLVDISVPQTVYVTIGVDVSRDLFADTQVLCLL
jgi:NAD(P)H-hydrate epimerase